MFQTLKRIFGVETKAPAPAGRLVSRAIIEAGRSTPADQVMTVSIVDLVMVITFLEREVPAEHSLAAVEEIRSLLLRELSVRDLLFDLTNVAFMDSTGLGMIVDLLGVLRARHVQSRPSGGPGGGLGGSGGGRIAIAAATDRVQVLFKLTKLELVFIIRRSVPDAMTALMATRRVA